MITLFRNRLKELRISRGLNRKQLGEIIGVSYTAIRLWEEGIAKAKIPNIIKLVLFFGVTANYLLGVDD